ncbi:hypothetical protein STVA_20520 [Allostella vacuolata]|nr:hypothetical protein STVA_20520 [Stella vacuolata]
MTATTAMTLPPVQLIRRQGWPPAPSDGWSIADFASVELVFPTPVPAGFARLVEVELDVYLPRGRPHRSVSVVAAEVPVATRLIYSGRTQTLRFALNGPLPERIAVGFLCENVGPPRDHGESDDARQLGIRIHGIVDQIEPIDLDPKRRVIAFGRGISEALFPPVSVTDAWHNLDHLIALVQEAIRSQTPFSFIRFGDGEGRLLGSSMFFTNMELLRETIGYQYGAEAIVEIDRLYGRFRLEDAIADLRQMLLSSLDNADAVGLPSPKHFTPEPDASNINGLLGFASSLIAIQQRPAHIPADNLFDTYIFHGMQRRSLFPRILDHLPFVGLVNHTDLSQPIAEHFHIERTHFVRIPGHKSFMSVDKVHFPTMYGEILEAIEVPFPGAVYLVGAGYLGKVYCDAVKQKGGIALDIGSVFDGWSGVGRVRRDENAFMRMQPRSP